MVRLYALMLLTALYSSMAFGNNEEQEITDSLNLARLYLSDGAVSGTLGITAMLIDKYPSDARAYQLASKAFLARGDINTALAILQKALTEVGAEHKQKLNKIIQEMQQLAQQVNKEQLLTMAMEALDSEDYVKAGQHFELLFALEDDNFEYASMAIDAYMVADNNEAVLRVINSVDLGIIPEEELEGYMELTSLLNEIETGAAQAETEAQSLPAATPLPELQQQNPIDSSTQKTTALPQEQQRKTENIIINSLGMKFRFVPARRMSTGPSPKETDYDYETEKNINFKVEGFYLSETEVTQKQWNMLMSENPSVHLGDDLPVHRVSFFATRDFLRKLTRKEKKRYRLPTEVEWERACKGDDNTVYAGTNHKDELHQYAWFKRSGRIKSPTKVASGSANQLNIFDLSGNGYEWVTEVKSYPGLVGFNIIKGGSWASSASANRCSHRAFVSEGDFELDTSFRVVMISE